ncbi:MAG: response regulator [Planctomycetota bacterium]
MKAPSASPRFLVVDDEEVDRIALARGFRRAGFHCELTMARDGKEALGLLQSESVERPFLVLLDLNMPRMGGFALLDAIRADSSIRKTVVFVLTTSDDDADIENAYRKGAAGYVVKGQSGDTFVGLASLLERYWRTVRLP